MQCQQCGEVLPEGAPQCPACGFGSVAPEPPAAPTEQSEVQPADPIPHKKRHIGRVLAMVAGAIVLLGAAGAAVLLLLPASPTTSPLQPAYAPVKVDTSFTDTGTLSAVDAAAADKTAAENAVVTFYETIDAGDFAALGALVTSDTRSAVDKGTFKGWASTTFTVVRSAVESGTALVFGHESRRAFGSKTRGVKFTLQRMEAAWLIETWQAADEGAVNGAMPSFGQGAAATALSAATARDLVDTLLQARQKGDADTIRLLTTAKFQKAHGAAWLDGVDNSSFFTKFTITSVKKKGAAFAVTVHEVWNSGTETATYTVIETAGSLLADTWTSK